MKLIAWCRGAVALATGGRVHAQLARAGLEDQPVEVTGAGVDDGKPSTSRKKARVASASSE